MFQNFELDLDLDLKPDFNMKSDLELNSELCWKARKNYFIQILPQLMNSRQWKETEQNDGTTALRSNIYLI
ncbi:uncharacterized protein ASCRUDRAFT_128416 [Ascoidea rubescens DSM 1968]|uniref:Uncharacterized protein n=1 Tax=Ascoidea rubescens DSM 1968 TaxID=1344418 RepID=A0A1D2V909_9ASCO|nr:hypothetical protein ASCRUDRAFT_128416 [Ascoidea rubescens DSM 1968]ODV58176.1 hypothetical protein ASCRUDRAFT_128416 [Ascoidea rubescens DSM 1968]